MCRNPSILIARVRFGESIGIAREHVASWRSAVSEMLLNYYLVAVFAAKDAAGNVIGFGSCHASRRPGARLSMDGELQSLCVSDDWQGHGVSRALEVAMAEHLQAAGSISAMVWVLRENSARWFYEALGGIVSAEATIKIAGKSMFQVAYGWPNIETLLHRTLADRYDGSAGA